MRVFESVRMHIVREVVIHGVVLLQPGSGVYQLNHDDFVMLQAHVDRVSLMTYDYSRDQPGPR